ncbi:MAG TPA: ABC transporter substrate-binding protein, partial [Actinomycetota bacterium]|nr:ABC transporter substrate-binding protein [Actinomycetota bacterium]
SHLADPALHRALSLALDRESLARNVYGELAVPATGLVPPSIPGYRSGACGSACRLNVERARQIVSRLPQRSRSFALDYSDSAVGTRLAESIAADLGEVGLNVTPRPHAEQELTTLLREGGQDVHCLVWVADYPRQQAFLEPLLDSTSADNLAAFDDPSMDQALERARVTPNPTDREAQYREVEELALADMPVVPLVWFRSHLAAKPYVSGFALDPLGRFDAASLALAG